MEIWAIVMLLAADLLSGGALLAWLAPSGLTGDRPTVIACNPPVVDDDEGVSITCPGVDDRAARMLIVGLSGMLAEWSHPTDDAGPAPRRPDGRAGQLRRRADDWDRRYHELSALPDASPQARKAAALVQQGEFEQAEAAVAELAALAELPPERAATIQYALGDIAMLRFNPAGARQHFENAARLQPDNPLYADGFATAAWSEHQAVRAELAWTASLQRYRDLAARDPASFRPQLAATLDKLVLLDCATGRPREAERVAAEELAITRELAAAQPTAYRPILAHTLRQLGALQRINGQLLTLAPADAERSFAEALAIYRDLAAGDAQAWRGEIAVTLNDIGPLYREAGRLQDAERALSEALTSNRDAALHNPGVFRPELAITLHELGQLYRDTGRNADAGRAFAEALAIRRDIAARDPVAYRPELATTLDALGILYSDAGRLAEAEAAHAEALAIWRDLASGDPVDYRASVAAALVAIALIYGQTGRSEDAAKAFTEALMVYRDLASRSPGRYAGAVETVSRRLSELGK